MVSPSDALGYMDAKVDETVSNVEGSIGQVEEQIDVTLEEIVGVENGLCAVAETDLAAYLDGAKLTELQALWPAVPASLGPVYIVYGPTYGTIGYGTGNLTDWEYRQDNLVIVPPAITPVPPYYVRYVYLAGDDTEIDTFVDDYAFGNDYLTRPQESGATYGLYDTYSSLNTAKDILTANKDKVAASASVFSRYK